MNTTTNVDDNGNTLSAKETLSNYDESGQGVYIVTTSSNSAVDSNVSHANVLDQSGDVTKNTPPPSPDYHRAELLALKAKQHGTLWEPPVVYINAELAQHRATLPGSLSEDGSDHVREMDGNPGPDHKETEHHEHVRSCTNSPSNVKATCHCCHGGSGGRYHAHSDQVMHHRQGIDSVRHHHSNSSHHVFRYDHEHPPELLYMSALDGEERSAHYYIRPPCHCSSCQKPRHSIETSRLHSPTVYSSRESERRTKSSIEHLKSLLPDVNTKEVYLSYFRYNKNVTLLFSQLKTP